jgi:hypothetical protein
MPGELSDTKKGLQQRIAKKRPRGDLPPFSTMGKDDVQRFILGLLNAFGVDYRIDRIVPPPDVETVVRQGTFWVPPATDIYTPTQRCFTFRARDGGYLVIDFLDFIAEDPIGEDDCTIRYWFGDQENTPNFQEDKAVVEPGHWKFSKVVLVDGEILTVCIENSNPYAAALWSYEHRSWML